MVRKFDGENWSSNRNSRTKVKLCFKHYFIQFIRKTRFFFLNFILYLISSLKWFRHNKKCQLQSFTKLGKQIKFSLCSSFSLEIRSLCNTYQVEYTQNNLNNSKKYFRVKDTNGNIFYSEDYGKKSKFSEFSCGIQTEWKIIIWKNQLFCRSSSIKWAWL